ncbi:YidB family protein [Hamadaea tsunoensis]|uniref:YidB family protein n=1 Tax=Hamadaea tsunoensis TaxID=53368 RepID=UPI000400B9AB|nr:YidB family protein [Hamadaea tsunoensis]
MTIDLSQIMKLLNDPNVRQMLSGVLSKLGGAQGGQNGQLGGLMDQLNSAGLGQQVQSWVGTGENQPVTGQQLTDALGADNLDQVAQQAGIAPDQAADQLAQVLPQLVDTATPNGQMPGPSDLQAMLGQLMGQKPAS